MPTDHFAIRAEGLAKCYALFDHPSDRLKQMLMRGRRRYYREFWALREVGFELPKGQVLGLVGRNGAGKSTLLQLICGTLAPTAGTVEVNGRVAALLELGAGFNPEFSGRENVYLSASILGLSKAETDRRFDRIVEFAELADFIDQPVKTYSSGMYVRLAFSVATSVDPDILIIDEALSVGDGAFARKSFDRIRSMKEAGKTILFCSHSLYQVEAFCDQAIWLEHGRCKLMGKPQEVVRRYTASLIGEAEPAAAAQAAAEPVESEPYGPAETAGPPPAGHARFTRAEASLDGRPGREFQGRPGENNLSILLQFASDPGMPTPTLGVTIKQGALIDVSCAVSLTDNIRVERDGQGRGEATIDFPRLPLRKGEYWINVHLGCENAVYLYETLQVATVTIIDPLPEPGLVNFEHRWQTRAGHDTAPAA